MAAVGPYCQPPRPPPAAADAVNTAVVVDFGSFVA